MAVGIRLGDPVGTALGHDVGLPVNDGDEVGAKVVTHSSHPMQSTHLHRSSHGRVLVEHQGLQVGSSVGCNVGLSVGKHEG